MCRLLAYKGVPIIMDQLIFAPKNSLINQSFDAKEIEEPLNGDGFGIGWYVPEIDPVPAVFVSIFPAWSNRNLKAIAPKIKSQCLFAHVRAASFGDISEANCHPFQRGRFLMMHNGSIEGFDQIKRKIRARLSDATYGWVRGQTDSEHFFGLFLDRMQAHGDNWGVTQIADALQDAINQIEALKREGNIEGTTWLNTVVTDGRHMVATRFASKVGEEPLTLYYSEGSRYVCEDGVCHMVAADPKEHAVLIVSEKLTATKADWRKIPANHMILVDSNDRVSFRPIEVDQRYRASA